VLPRHKLEAALEHGEYKNAWATTASPADFAVSGPFTLEEYTPGQRTTLNGMSITEEGHGGQSTCLTWIRSSSRRLIIRTPDYSSFSKANSTFSTTFRRLITRRFKDKPGPVAVRDIGPWLQTDVLWFKSQRRHWMNKASH